MLHFDRERAWRNRRRFWQQFLQSVCGWSQAEAAEWAEQYRAQAFDPRSLFYHDFPTSLLVPVLIPQSLVTTLAPDELHDLRRDLHAALLAASPRHMPGGDPDYDFEAAASAVAEILKRYQGLRKREGPT